MIAFTDFDALVDTVPQLRRGTVWCTKCGRSQDVFAAIALRIGWPTCCGHTMTIDSPAERIAFARTSTGGT